MAEKTKSRQNPNRVFLSRSKNLPYLPSGAADIVSAAFFLDLKLQKKVMKLRIRNRTDRAITAMTVLARYLDKNGQVIGDADGHIVLRFTGIFCPPHQTTHSSKTVVLPYQDIAGIEAYITAVAFEDGTAAAFSPEDYVCTPRQEMLEERLDEGELRLLRRQLSDSCVFVPQIDVPAPPHWLCACGAVAEGATCSACALSRTMAETLADKKKTAAWLRTKRTRALSLKILPYAAALVLFCGGVLVLRGYVIHYKTETLPADRLAVTRQYLAEDRYREALGYSVTKNQSILYDEILDAAVAYYCAEGNFAEAAAFEKCRAEPSYEKIYQSAAEAFIDGRTDQAEYALSTADETLYNRVCRRLTEEAAAENDWNAACSYALAMRGTEGQEYADSVLYDAISWLLEDLQYENAVLCIARLHDKSGVSALCRGIESELLDRGKYEDAFTVASITGDTSVFERAYSTAGAGTVRRYYDHFAAFMSAAEQRAFLAATLSAGGCLARIQSGTAEDSVRGVLCQNAVSVAAGAAHVLVLQTDGTVRAFGDNSYGQCGCEGITNAVAVAAGANHSLVLQADGTVRAFGDNSAGQCNTDGWENVIAIAAGTRHSAAVCADSTVRTCGSNESGQCSTDNYEDVVGVACGEYSTVLLLRDSTIAVTGNIAIECFDTKEWEDVTAVAVGNEHLVALTSGGRVLVSGTPTYGSVEECADWSRVREIACGAQAVYAANAYGQILLCGSETVSLLESGWETVQP